MKAIAALCVSLVLALMSVLGGLIVCVVVGLVFGLICRCVYLGWHAAWSVFT